MLGRVWTPIFPFYPCYIQRKYDGIRGVWLNGKMTSRDEHLWRNDIIQNITDCLRLLPFQYLDGEFYTHGMSLQQINERVAVNRVTPHADINSVKFTIFDTIESDTQEVRLTHLVQLIQFLDSFPQLKEFVEVAPTYYCPDRDFGDMCYDQFLKEGYEGAIYRRLDMPYGFEQACGNKENRWNYVSKRKESEDADCDVIGLVEGEGKYVGKVGSFQLRHPNNRVFHAGTGLTDSQRELYWTHPPKRVRVVYRRLSDDNVPIEPRIAATLA